MASGRAGAPDLAQVVDAHLPALRGYIASLGIHPDLVDDVAHDVFLELLRHPDRYDASRPLRAWLFGIARNLALQELRRGRTESRLRSGLVAEALLARTGEAPDGEESPLATTEGLQALRECLAGLSERIRRLVNLRFGQHLAPEQIARELDMGGSAVRTALMRARWALRECVESRLGGQRR
ncbi:MAG TPA: sigma-70 family RNA polymerase sigma factor [Planctomycetota bacterium]|nr:sigma-70 family RNA polymerase sigma factor [Planctomycetota bacterium]